MYENTTLQFVIDDIFKTEEIKMKEEIRQGYVVLTKLFILPLEEEIKNLPWEKRIKIMTKTNK